MGEPKTFIGRIINNPIVQALAIYISSGWILIELLEYFIENFGLIEKSRNILLIILLSGLPMTLFLSWYLHRERKKDREAEFSGDASEKKTRRLFKRPAIGIPLVVIAILLMVFGIGFLNHRSKSKKVREEILPQIHDLSLEGNYKEAFLLFMDHEKHLNELRDISRLKTDLVKQLNIVTDPPGAKVFIRDYSDVTGEWEQVGRTPIDSLKLAKHSYHQVKFSLDGYEEVLAITSARQGTLSRKLHREGEIPEGMVYVDGLGDGQTNADQEQTKGFFLDRYEVSNRDYKEFVDQGAYRNREFWKHSFLKDGEILSWEEAMAEFVDRSGRPGPAGWEASDYAAGQGNFPVSGISWYEAAAYAAFAGKQLPTDQHWYAGAGLTYFDIQYYLSSSIIKLSNFDGSGPEEIGSRSGMNGYGTFDMAGNIREWCWNETTSGHMVRGGAWNDGGYTYYHIGQAPSFDRSQKNGFRCAIYPDRGNLPDELFQQVTFEVHQPRDFYAEEPVDERIFEIYRKGFEYDNLPLDSRVEEANFSDRYFTSEKITFNAPYNNERMEAYLFLPKNHTPPYPTMIFFPGSGALGLKDFFMGGFTNYNFLVKNGYAVLYPVYKGTYDRGFQGPRPDPVTQSHAYTDWITQIVQDYKRCMDYLGTRSDIDGSRIGFIGSSLGSRLGGIILAVEPRTKIGVLKIGGLGGSVPPETDPFNYVSRIRIPVLMLNGRYDPIFPLETNVRPFFDYLGTPDGDKHLYIADTDHWIPQADHIRETLNWLDRYFGTLK